MNQFDLIKGDKRFKFAVIRRYNPFEPKNLVHILRLNSGDGVIHETDPYTKHLHSNLHFEQTITLNIIKNESIISNLNLTQTINEVRYVQITVTDNLVFTQTISQNTEFNRAVNSNLIFNQTVSENSVFNRTVNSNLIITHLATEINTTPTSGGLLFPNDLFASNALFPGELFP
jgi:hypothetical protein